MNNYTTFISKKSIKVNMPIPKDVIDIALQYNKFDKDIFVVGGSVRDFIQGKIPHDYDLVTNATPEESKKILKGWNVSDEQGKNFGVIRVYTKSEPLGYEIAVFRSDISSGRDTKGDDKKVDFGSHIGIETDCKRRDLTINSLYYDINKKEIIDLVGGIDDIKNGIIKTVGTPADRFNEDRLRICRIFRFTARTNGNIDKETSEAIKKDNRLRDISIKDDVSQERIIQEFDKVFEHAIHNPSILQRYINLLTEYDMWKQMFPGININNDIKVDIVSKSIVFLDLFWKENINSNRKLLNKLTFSNDLINEMNFLQDYAIDSYNIENVYKLAKLKERFNIENKLIIDFSNHKKLNKKFTNSFIKYCDSGFVINGFDLMKNGFKGVEIEKEKQRLEVLRFMEDFNTL